MAGSTRLAITPMVWTWCAVNSFSAESAASRISRTSRPKPLTTSSRAAFRLAAMSALNASSVGLVTSA